MPSNIVNPEALVRLIEVELVNQYRRFLKKHIAISPKTCRFNELTTTPEGGFIRMCRCPKSNPTSALMSRLADQYSDKPCVSLNYAKKCPLYQHYTGAASPDVVAALTEDFLIRLEDSEKRATSFKTLHTLWLILHETETFHLNWVTRIQLKICARIFNTKYLAYVVRRTPKAEVVWSRLTKNFRVALNIPTE